jgi:hypothetical protein
MDFNYLYFRRGVEKLRADSAACPPSRAAHAELADRYGDMIEGAREDRDAAPAMRAGEPRD